MIETTGARPAPGNRCVRVGYFFRNPLKEGRETARSVSLQEAMDPNRRRDDREKLPPWEQPGAVRRDCEPHRGELLMHMAAASFACAALGCLSWGITGILSIALGLSVLILARRDLAAMSAGSIDPSGEWITRRARRRSVRAIALCVGIWSLASAILLPDLFHASMEIRYLTAVLALGLVSLLTKVAVTVR